MSVFLAPLQSRSRELLPRRLSVQLVLRRAAFETAEERTAVSPGRRAGLIVH